MRCVYLDLDGTFLGPGGALVYDADKAFTLLGVRAVEACFRAGAEIVLMSGRRQVQLAEDARLIGQSSYIFELGACVMVDGEEEWLTGEWRPGRRTIYQQIEETGIPDLLLSTYAGRLEYHDPWHRGREVTHLFRGLVDEAEAASLLQANGHGDLRLVDNGVVHRRSPALADLPAVHAYHLLPSGASKANAVARHMQVRGYARDDCLGVGDSREDLDVAHHVSSFWLVANAVSKDPTIRAELGRYPNVRIAEAAHGPGVYEAVVTTLAERRGR